MTSRTAQDILGNTTKSTSFRDAYGDTLKTSSSKNILGDGMTSTSFSDPLGRTVRSRSAHARSTEAALKSSASAYAYLFSDFCRSKPSCAKRYWIPGRGPRRRVEAALARLFADVA